MQEEEEEKKSGWKIFLSLIFILIAIGLLAVYWFVPFNTIEFGAVGGNSNFSADSSGNSQFYQNMRYPSSEISYRINNCPLQKKNDMERGFEILGNKTILNFYPVNSGEEISVTCDSRDRLEGNLFIAGEGGPVNITNAGNFNVIFRGQILLIKDSECENPNVAIHELLHALGFEHSENPNNMMYNVSNCRQTIGDDTINLINKLYSVPNYPDLILENVSAVMHGKYLDANFTIKNYGFADSGNFKIEIYGDEQMIEEVDIENLEIGYGRIISLSNIHVLKLSVNEISFFANSSYEELNKENNKIKLKIKN